MHHWELVPDCPCLVRKHHFEGSWDLILLGKEGWSFSPLEMPQAKGRFISAPCEHTGAAPQCQEAHSTSTLTSSLLWKELPPQHSPSVTVLDPSQHSYTSIWDQICHHTAFTLRNTWSFLSVGQSCRGL